MERSEESKISGLTKSFNAQAKKDIISSRHWKEWWTAFASLQTLDGPKEFGGCQENITSLNCMEPNVKFSGARITFRGVVFQSIGWHIMNPMGNSNTRELLLCCIILSMTTSLCNKMSSIHKRLWGVLIWPAQSLDVNTFRINAIFRLYFVWIGHCLCCCQMCVYTTASFWLRRSLMFHLCVSTLTADSLSKISPKFFLNPTKPPLPSPFLSLSHPAVQKVNPISSAACFSLPLSGLMCGKQALVSVVTIPGEPPSFLPVYVKQALPVSCVAIN